MTGQNTRDALELMTRIAVAVTECEAIVRRKHTEGRAVSFYKHYDSLCGVDARMRESALEIGFDWNGLQTQALEHLDSIADNWKLEWKTAADIETAMEEGK